MINVGDTIHGYEVVELINAGGFCNAFKVKKGGRTLFMKEYSDPTELTKDFKEFFSNQVAIIELLNRIGDNTETIVEHFVYDSHYYQVKEYLSGKCLNTWMEENGDIGCRLEVAIQLTKIIQKIHSVGLVHQDLKPEQVMVLSESPIKIVLTDFDWSIPNGKVVRYVGSPWYLYVDDCPSEKSDIFTLGIILCELLTGATPYQLMHDNLFDREKWDSWVLNREYNEPIELNPDDITRKMNKMIVSCLSPNPSERPSLDEILSVLQNPKDVFRAVTLVNGAGRLFIPVGASADRRDFKICFPETTDEEGNPIYMYISHDVKALNVVRDGYDVSLSASNELSNKFLLNSAQLSSTPVRVQDGDTIELFSTKRSQVVASFKLELK